MHIIFTVKHIQIVHMNIQFINFIVMNDETNDFIKGLIVDAIRVYYQHENLGSIVNSKKSEIVFPFLLSWM